MTTAAPSEEVKSCRGCSEVKPVEEFYRHQGGRHPRCKECVRAADRERYQQKNGKDRVFAQSLMRRYGITLEQYNQMSADQQHLCAMCGEKPETAKRMHVDHDHATGKIRALLCHHCNLLLGNAKDSIDRLRMAIAYLEQHHPAYALASKLAERLQPDEGRE